MRRCLDVSSLTRPQRIRCRSAFLSPLALGRYRASTLPAPNPDQRSSSYDLIQAQKRSREDIDLEETLEVEKQHIEWKQREQTTMADGPGASGPRGSFHEIQGDVDLSPRGFALSNRRSEHLKTRLVSLVQARSADDTQQESPQCRFHRCYPDSQYVSTRPLTFTSQRNKYLDHLVFHIRSMVAGKGKGRRSIGHSTQKRYPLHCPRVSLRHPAHPPLSGGRLVY